MSLGMEQGIILLPSTITAVEPLAVIYEFKGPPSGHARQLPPAHAIALASRSYGSKQIEEVEDDLFAGLGLDAEWNKGVEGVPSKVGVCGAR